MAQGARAGQRRRLWQLPTQAHELLLAMSFTPDGLRREAARTLGQVHKGQCVLKGRDVDVLYSVVHDMATRNALSEALHKRLDARHANAVRRLSALRDADALQAAWSAALADDSVPAALWAVLTHALGASMQPGVLHDARQWVFEHARRSVALKQAQLQAEEHVLQARQRAAQLQARLTAQQQKSAEALRLAQAEIVRLQGAVARLRVTDAPGALPAAAGPTPGQRCAPAGHLARRPAADHRPAPAATAATAATAAKAAKTAKTASDAAPLPTAAPAAPPEPVRSQPVAVAGRRVLCVGGIQHAVARYRGRIEGLGGRFEHHDGGLEDNVHALDARLQRADVVICQAACINHDAYHRVKRHCERTGTPCLYLDRPSLSRLDRALAPAPSAHRDLHG